jgi:hypothetical protein
MDDVTMVREFRSQLFGFGGDVERYGEDTLQEASAQTIEAVVLGNRYGPGAPLDEGILRGSFRVGRNAPVDGPSEGGEVGGPLDLTPAYAAKLGDTVYGTTMMHYAEPLETKGLTRRHGPAANIGTSTAFVKPVEQHFERIVDDAADRVGFAR